MSRLSTYALNVPGSNGAGGAPADVSGLRDVTVGVSGGGVFSFKIQVKLSGRTPSVSSKPIEDNPPGVPVNNDWIDFATVTANSVTALAQNGVSLSVSHVRIFRTSGDGAQAATLAGRGY